MTVFKTSVPFGSGAKRFLYVGYHPNLEYRSGTRNFIRIAPGCYEYTKYRKVISKVPSWKKEVEVEEFSKNFGYRYEHVKKKKWLKSINGPGWQEVRTTSLTRGLFFPASERFSNTYPKSYSVPGPGTYGKNHIPHSRIEEKSLSKGFSFSTIPPFEQRSRAPRSLNIQLSYHLPPNLYKVKNGIDEMLAKKVSKKGPYELFSLERFPDAVHSQLSPRFVEGHPWTWNHPKNSFKGKFSRCGRENQITSRLALISYAWCKRNPLDPGPNHYNPYPDPEIPQLVAPFSTSSVEVRPPVKCSVSPPPGRYQPEMKRKIKGGGMRSCFLSKVRRNLNYRDKYSWFE